LLVEADATVFFAKKNYSKQGFATLSSGETGFLKEVCNEALLVGAMSEHRCNFYFACKRLVSWLCQSEFRCNGFFEKSLSRGRKNDERLIVACTAVQLFSFGDLC
jgi:hypothetical protein